ncbi:2-oxo acid dehydrogenase subunit E2 [Zoogloeaceae bacterium G21618-S1]|jgi:pyruvate dehydrogenase E2 component (dihydrolipoamide acetyltransferase)|nr:2-oxo acid dehydrogenase subunit E2 [Zoogloeaceae bacterium G21618-S1]
MSRIHKLSGQNLHHSRVMIPHGTNFDEADITDMEAFQQRVNAEQGEGGANGTMLASSSRRPKSPSSA